MDEDGYISIPIAHGENIKEDYVGKNIEKYDCMITLSHFKSHAMGSFGGALIERIESRNGLHTLEHAEKIGLPNL